MASAASLAPIEIEDEETILKLYKLSSPYYIEDMDETHNYLIIEENDFQYWYFEIYNYLKNKKFMIVSIEMKG